MKKQFLIFFILFCFTAFNLQAAAEQVSNSNWVKLRYDIYLDKTSINNDEYWTYGWFKIYASADIYMGSINGVIIRYQLVKFGADCTDDSLALMHVKEFDEEGRLLTDEPIDYNKGFSSYRGVADGEIYFNAICKYKAGE